MKNISEYGTIHEFWEELRDFSDGNEHFKPVPRRWYQEQLRARAGTVDARLIRRQHLGPTSLRVSIAQSDSPQRRVTKLDFNGHWDSGAEAWQKVGHLVLPPEPGQRAHGIQVDNISDIPEAALPALDTLDRGVQLILKHSLLQLWVVGRNQKP